MPISVELVVGTSVAFLATVTFWYSLLSSRIKETTKDLQAGEKFRLSYVAEQLRDLEPNPGGVIQVIRKLGENPDPRTTAELKTKVEELNRIVGEIDSIHNAQSRVVTSMRETRDRGLTILIATGMILIGAELASDVVSDIMKLVVGLVAFAMIYFICLIVGFLTYRSHSNARTVMKLLREKDLDAIGA